MATPNPATPNEIKVVTLGQVLTYALDVIKNRIKKAKVRYRTNIFFKLVVYLFVVAFAWTCWTVYTTMLHRQVIILAGPSDSDSLIYARKIKDYLVNRSQYFLFRYNVEIIQTEGFADNRQKIIDDNHDKLIIGFDQDGFEPDNKLRTLLPLNDATLHVFVSKKLEGELYNNLNWLKRSKMIVSNPNKFQSFGEYLSMFQSQGRTPKCFIGPKHSGSRLVTTRILNQYGIPATKVDVGDHLEWETAFNQLSNSEIDFIFSIGDIGSPITATRVRNYNLKIVSLDNISGLLQNNKSFRPQKILKGTYDLNPTNTSEGADTISTKRLIVCSDSLSTFDVYYLTSEIETALRYNFPGIEWERTDKL